MRNLTQAQLRHIERHGRPCNDMAFLRFLDPFLTRACRSKWAREAWVRRKGKSPSA
jgi:hypothetical protein